MKLADVVTLTKQPRWTKKQTAESESVQTALSVRNRYDSADTLFEFANRDEKSSLKSLQKKLSTRFNVLRSDILLKEHSLPKVLWNEEAKDTLTKAAKAPRINLSEAREIADKLGFVIVPYEYLDSRSYQDESPELVSAIKAFNKKLSDLYSIYVLAPVHHYSVENHVRAVSDLKIYPGKPCEQAFLAIDMAVPVFRTIFLNLDQLREQAEETAERVNSNTAAINTSRREIKNLARRVDTLQKQVERQREEAVIEATKQENLRNQLNELRAQNRFWAYEPMMLAIPKESSIEDDVPAIVGPCWGPDFEDIVVTALGMKNIEGQGEMLDKAALQWVGMGAEVKSSGSFVPSLVEFSDYEDLPTSKSNGYGVLRG